MMRLWSKLVLISVIVLTAAAANAGSFAPAPRVVVTLDRDFLEGSGSQNLGELLDTGIIRYLLTGGQSLPVLVNGRPYSSTTGDLDALPLAAMERIELVGGESLGTFGGSTVRNALTSCSGRIGTARRCARSRDGPNARAATVIRATHRGAEKSAMGI